VKGTVLFGVVTHPGQTVRNFAAVMGTISQMKVFSRKLTKFMSVLLPCRQFRYLNTDIKVIIHQLTDFCEIWYAHNVNNG
jgi:hypothetical protein